MLVQDTLECFKADHWDAEGFTRMSKVLLDIQEFCLSLILLNIRLFEEPYFYRNQVGQLKRKRGSDSQRDEEKDGPDLTTRYLDNEVPIPAKGECYETIGEEYFERLMVLV